MHYWLLKTEPDSYSIDDLKKDAKTSWEGVRNYQARNFLRAMEVGDQVLIYHSSCDVPACVGVGVIRKAAISDATAIDPQSKYYDPKSASGDNRWSTVEVAYVSTFTQAVPLSSLRADPKLDGLKLLEQGSRLSVIPVLKAHFDRITSLGK